MQVWEKMMTSIGSFLSFRGTGKSSNGTLACDLHIFTCFLQLWVDFWANTLTHELRSEPSITIMPETSLLIWPWERLSGSVGRKFQRFSDLGLEKWKQRSWEETSSSSRGEGLSGAFYCHVQVRSHVPGLRMELKILMAHR